jgi:hypothetical protein
VTSEEDLNVGGVDPPCRSKLVARQIARLIQLRMVRSLTGRKSARVRSVKKLALLGFLCMPPMSKAIAVCIG